MNGNGRREEEEAKKKEEKDWSGEDGLQEMLRDFVDWLVGCLRQRKPFLQLRHKIGFTYKHGLFYWQREEDYTYTPPLSGWMECPFLQSKRRGFTRRDSF
jgi:hypothetical protein